PRLGELHLLNAVGCDERDRLALELVRHGHPSVPVLRTRSGVPRSGPPEMSDVDADSLISSSTRPVVRSEDIATATSPSERMPTSSLPLRTGSLRTLCSRISSSASGSFMSGVTVIGDFVT